MIKRLSSLVLFSVLAAWLCAAGPADASRVKKVDVEALTKQADVIVLGSVTAVTPKLDKERGTVSTYVTVEVSYQYKGRRTKEVTIRVPGGTAEGKSLMVIGAPKFEVDDRVFLLLEKDVIDPSVYRVAGFFQGRYIIFKTKGRSYAVMDQGKGFDLIEQCGEDKIFCLEYAGYEVSTYLSLAKRVKAVVDREIEKEKAKKK